MSWKEALKEIIQKAVTVGVMAVAAAVQGGAPVNQALAAVFAYAVWIQVIVPRVNEWLNGPEKLTASGISKTGWALI